MSLVYSPFHSQKAYPPSRTAKDYSDLVTIKVGSPGVEIKIYKAWICYYSEYFTRAFNGAFTEGKTGVSVLEDESVETFTRFFNWLHSRQFCDSPQTKPNDFDKQLLDLYILGDKRVIPAVCNAAIDALLADSIETWSFPFYSEFITKLYNNTPEGSKMRKLVIDMIAKTRPRMNFLNPKFKGSDFSDEFLMELLVAINLSRRRCDWVAEDKWSEVDRCQYHYSLDRMKAGWPRP